MVNRHVLGFYVMAVCLAFESSVDPSTVQQVAECKLQLQVLGLRALGQSFLCPKP